MLSSIDFFLFNFSKIHFTTLAIIFTVSPPRQANLMFARWVYYKDRLYYHLNYIIQWIFFYLHTHNTIAIIHNLSFLKTIAPLNEVLIFMRFSDYLLIFLYIHLRVFQLLVLKTDMLAIFVCLIQHHYVIVVAFYPLLLTLYHCVSSAYIFIRLGCRTLLEVFLLS